MFLPSLAAWADSKVTPIRESNSSYTYKEIQSGAVTKSYMRKGFLIYIYEEMRKYFPIYEEAFIVIYDFATAPF